MKRANLFLAILPLVVLTGCGKTITKADAKNYVEANFSKEKVYATYQQYKLTTISEIKKATGYFSDIYNRPSFGEGGSYNTSLEGAPIVDSTFITLLPEDAKITMSSDSMNITYNISIFDVFHFDEEIVKGTAVVETKIDNIGLIYSDILTLKCTVDTSKTTNEKISGSLVFVTTKTYEYFS